MFLRVGGSLRELKIDTKRLQYKNNNDLEEEGETIHHKNINIARHGSNKKSLS